MVSLRGASRAEFERRASELGHESALGRLAERGTQPALRPLANAETFPAMATFETGAWPARHGVVGNAYHFGGELSAVDPVATAASLLGIEPPRGSTGESASSCPAEYRGVIRAMKPSRGAPISSKPGAGSNGFGSRTS